MLISIANLIFIISIKIFNIDARHLCLYRVVESVGEGVEDLVPGDHVVPIFNGECGACAYCSSTVTNLCKSARVNPFKSTMTLDNGTRFSIVDQSTGTSQPVYHFLNTSTFAEYTVLDSACAVKINPDAPLEKMCLLSCGISTGNLILSPRLICLVDPVFSTHCVFL
jgi:Zn-dependent alcohol dehydrogenase